MKRKTFITRLIGIGGLLSVPANVFTTYQRYYLLQCFVSGFQYHRGPAWLGQMLPGDQIELNREPDNVHDRCAIALIWRGEKIGYLPATSNEILSKLLDTAALKLTAQITHINTEVQTWENVCVAVSFLKENDTPAPVAAYLTALDEPRYTAYLYANDTESRIDWEEEYENDTDWYGFLIDNSRNDSIYDIIHSSNVKPDYNYGAETGEYFVVNKKEIEHGSEIAHMIDTAERSLGVLDKIFGEQGYLVLSTQEIAGYVHRISHISDVADKLGRHYIKLNFF
jgi:hypothetical protein